jgi:hypothetical protein
MMTSFTVHFVVTSFRMQRFEADKFYSAEIWCDKLFSAKI